MGGGASTVVQNQYLLVLEPAKRGVPWNPRNPPWIRHWLCVKREGGGQPALHPIPAPTNSHPLHVE